MSTRYSQQAAAAHGRRRAKPALAAAVFLAPALTVLTVLVVYSIVYTIMRSFFDVHNVYVGLNNYVRVFSEERMLTAVRNNAIWVAIVPAVITSLGLILAVLTEKIRWATAFKVALFMPLVVSGLAAGVTFRFIYSVDPNIGLANAVVQSAAHLVRPPGLYPGARMSVGDHVVDSDGAIVLTEAVALGQTVNFPLVGLRPQLVPDTAEQAAEARPSPETISGAVWLDFLRGGTLGVPEEGKRGLPGVRVEALRDGTAVAVAYTGPDGVFRFDDLAAADYTVALSASNFRQPFGGFHWLGRGLVVPATIFAYIWINTGFALIIIGAGLAGINRDFIEAARVEGANDWSIFRFITIPLLMPILSVVFVRTVISVLKVIDIVMVVAPEPVQGDATVLALEMWYAAFGGMRDFGLGSALATILFILILPVMLSNIRRFRLEEMQH